MPIQEFSLKPFKFSPETLDLDVTGKVSRRGAQLSLNCELLGNLSDISIPEQKRPAGRADDLWQATCFECFIRPVTQSRYWEFNLSPSYCWNVYRFSHYRQGGQAEARVDGLSFEVLSTATVLQLAWTFDLTQLALAQVPIAVAIAAVIQSKSGQLSYWALTHPQSQPDFHHRGSFALTL